MRRLRDGILNVGAVVATLVAATAIANRVVMRGAGAVEVPTRQVEGWTEYSRNGVRTGADAARVTIVKFSDFTCSYCKQAAEVLRAVVLRYPEDVALVYRHFPLREAALDAAVAAECANHMGRFWEMHDILFAQSDSIGAKPVAAMARDAGVLDTVTFQACVKDARASEVVWRDIHAADSLGVAQTPTFLVNDRLFVGTPQLPGFERYIVGLIRQGQ